MYGTRIIIADGDAAFRKKLKESLRHAGYMPIGEAGDAHSALQVVFQAEPDLVVLEHRLPGSEMHDVPSIILEHRVAPMVLTITYNQQEIIDFARIPGVYGVLLKPLQEPNLQPVVETALANFERVVKLEKEIKELRKNLEARKLLERAKGLLMEKKGMTEQEAHKFIQKMSMAKCVSVNKIAKSVILSLQRDK